MTRQAPLCSAIFVLLLLPAMAGVLSCGDDDGFTAQEPIPDYNEGLQDAWGLFRGGESEAAAVIFEDLAVAFPDRADPRTGLGWCLLRRPDLDSALARFQEALHIAVDGDALAGLAVTASALGLDSLAVAAVVDLDDPYYIFVGDPSLAYDDLLVIRAVGEFHLMRWEECRDTLLMIAPGLDIDLSAWDFRDQLLAAIEQVSDR